MFSIILFLICFCLASIALYEPAAIVETKVAPFDQFYSAISEVLAPEPFAIAEPTQPLSLAQTDNHHQAQTIINSVQVTSIAQSTPPFTIRQLVRFVD